MSDFRSVKATVPATRTITVLIRVIAAAAVAAALAACGAGRPPPEQPGADNQALLTAGKTAQAAVSDSTLVSIETERNDARWEVQVVTADGTEYEVRVSADGTLVTSGPDVKDEGPADKSKHRDRVGAAKLDYRQAVSVIMQARPGRITELNLDTHNGTTVWEADVRDPDNAKHEVSIDAASGHIVTKS